MNLLQVAGTNVWEEVDKYTFNNSHRALKTDGSPRYGDNRVTVNGDKLDIKGTLTTGDLAILCRILAIPQHTGSTPKGFCQNPRFIKFKTRNGKSAVLRDLHTGENWKKAA